MDTTEKMKKYKYSTFKIFDSNETLKDNLNYEEVCNILNVNKHKLFAKYISEIGTNKSWDCEHFLRYETNIK
jgi:hypothetical protein